MTWRSWSISKWLELETKEQERRSEEVDVMKTEIVAPKQAGDDTRGWFRHWRRGLEGALIGWAAPLAHSAPSCTCSPLPLSSSRWYPRCTALMRLSHLYHCHRFFRQLRSCRGSLSGISVADLR